MDKIKCEVCMGLGLARDVAVIYEELCTSCNGKGHFDSPEDSIDHWVEAANHIVPNWRGASVDMVKFKESE